MWHQIPIRIMDPGSVLSELDQHQLENMIWLRLSASEAKIDLVQVEILKLNDGTRDREFKVLFSTTLKSGYTVECKVSGDSKVSALMASVAYLKDRVERRIRHETSLYYRTGRRIDNARRLFLESAQNLIGSPKRRCSGSAS